MSAMDRTTVRYYRLFREHTGAVGHDAETSLALARAMRYAEAKGWAAEWEPDDDAGDWEDHRADCPVCRRRDEHTTEGCVLRDATGHPIGSLWGVWDADDWYRSFTEANLALDAMHDDMARVRERMALACWVA